MYALSAAFQISSMPELLLYSCKKSLRAIAISYAAFSSEDLRYPFTPSIWSSSSFFISNGVGMLFCYFTNYVFFKNKEISFIFVITFQLHVNINRHHSMKE